MIEVGNMPQKEKKYSIIESFLSPVYSLVRLAVHFVLALFLVSGNIFAILTAHSEVLVLTSVTLKRVVGMKTSSVGRIFFDRIKSESQQMKI